MAARIELLRRIRSARTIHVAVAMAAAVVAVLVVSAAEAATGAGVKRYAYTVQMTYSLAREAIDPATGAKTTVERRLEAEFRVWVNVSEDQVYTGTKGDYAEVDGKAVASVRDNRLTPPCAQVAEAKGRIGLKFVTNRAPLTSIWIPWSPGAATRPPALPCSATELERWESGKRGVGDWSQVDGSHFWHESRTTFYGDVFAKLTAGRAATFELADSAPGQSTRAAVRLVFTRAGDLEPKPAPPSATRVVVTKPAFTVGRYNATVGFVVTRGGDRTGVGKASCTGSFAGGPGLYGSPTVTVINLPRVHPGFLKLWPELRTAKGWVTYVVCGYEHDEYTKACGKTFRGALRLVVDGKRTSAKQFSFPWTAKGHPCS